MRSCYPETDDVERRIGSGFGSTALVNRDNALIGEAPHHKAGERTIHILRQAL